MLTAILRYQAVILKAEADAPFLAVDADIHAENHTRLYDIDIDQIMCVPANMVGAAVPDISADILIPVT